MDRETRKESSIPVQSRISIVDLAKMDLYWQRVENESMRTMSQLVSWTLSAMVEVIESNGKMPKGIESVVEAHRYLTARGLYQKSLRDRSKSRISAAMGFESLRKQGIDPALASSMAHSVVHSKKSIDVYEGSGVDWDEIGKRVEEEKERDVEQTINDAKAIGNIAERDEEIVKEENKPVDELDFNIVE